MSKKSSEQKLLAESLSNALNPQKKRGMPRDVLDQYDEKSEASGIPAGIPDAIPTGIPTGIPDTIPTGIPSSIPETIQADAGPKEPMKAARREASEPFTYLDATHTASEKAVYSVMYRETVSKGLAERNFGPAELLKKTGIGSRNTVHKALYGLIEKLSIEVVQESRGNPLGPRYRVFKWQEIDERRKAAGIRIDQQSKRIVGIPAGIPAGIPDAYPNNWDTGIPGAGIPGIPKVGTVINKEEVLSSQSTKTDDEAFAGLIALLRQATGEVTGKEPSAAERERWTEVGELLVAELKQGATRTTVSSVPAFLAEHLRRRLSRQPTPQPSPKPPASAVSKPAPEPPSDADLVEMFTGFLHQGMTLDELDGQLSASIDPERWPRIRQAALERYERERGQMRPPDAT